MSERGWWFDTGCREEVGGLIPDVGKWLAGGFNTGCGKEVGGLILGVGKSSVVWFWVSERGWWF